MGQHRDFCFLFFLFVHFLLREKLLNIAASFRMPWGFHLSLSMILIHFVPNPEARLFWPPARWKPVGPPPQNTPASVIDRWVFDWQVHRDPLRYDSRGPRWLTHGKGGLVGVALLLGTGRILDRISGVGFPKGRASWVCEDGHWVSIEWIIRRP